MVCLEGEVAVKHSGGIVGVMGRIDIKLKDSPPHFEPSTILATMLCGNIDSFNHDNFPDLNLGDVPIPNIHPIYF